MLSARVILVAVFGVKVQEDLSHVTGALMPTWLQCAPLSRKWPFQQESLDLLCGGCGGKSRKKSRQVSSTLDLELMQCPICLIFFWSNKIQGQLGFKGKGSRLLPNKRSGMFLQGGRNCWHPSLEIIYCRSCSKRCLTLTCLLLV